MIQPLKQTDYMVAKQLFQEVFESCGEPYFIKAWASRSRPSSLGYWVKGVLVGIAIVVDKELEYIGMHPDFRGDGSGTQLLNAVLDVCPTIHLSPVDDPAVKKWYAKHGFALSQKRGAYEVFARHEHNTRST